MEVPIRKYAGYVVLEYLFLQECPFFTLAKLPPGFVVHVGGIVSSKSVKLLDEINNLGNLHFLLFTFLHCIHDTFSLVMPLESQYLDIYNIVSKVLKLSSFPVIIPYPILIYFPDGHETRESWWNELRTEIRSHAKALGCHAVLGYTENTTIWYSNL